MAAKIYNKFTVILVFNLLIYKVNSDICDGKCLCRFNTQNSEIHGEYVDCSYKPFVLNSVNELPTTAYTLDLKMNNITSVERTKLFQSTSLKELYLNKNKIKEINDVFQLPELIMLDLSDNILESIHENTFNGMRKLEQLNLANNLFTTFEKLTFHHLSNLQGINLNNNKIGPSIREIDLFDRNGYGLTRKIREIKIRGIGMNKVPDNFFIEAYDLKKVDISKNNLSEIFEIPFTLEYLDLSDNPITIITMEDFSDLPGLKVLKLNNLKIKEVAEYTFAALHGLTDLELERNRNLTQFSALAFGRDALNDPDNFQLERLSLKASKLRTLSEDLLDPFGQLLRLDLQFNPWRCDCHLIWIKQLQIPSQDYEQLRCATPRPFYNRKIFELDDKFFACTIEKHFTGISIAVVTFCVILAAVALWLFLFLPKYQSRCQRFAQNFASPSAGYTVLPMGVRDPYAI